MARELNKAEIEEIEHQLAKIAEERLAAGFDPDKTILCDCCLYPKIGYKFVLHGCWHLCGDCELDFQIALAAKEVEKVEQFMAQRDLERLLLTGGLDL